MKKSRSKTFINELGNKITVKVRENKNSVNVKIIGPKSTAENTITKKEARELKRLT